MIILLLNFYYEHEAIIITYTMMGSNLDASIASILNDKEFMQETVQVYSCLLNSSSVMRYTKSPLLLVQYLLEMQRV
jgi:hypothetical protein